MFTRHLEKTLKKAARQYPVVTLTGPRQSGKTTLVRAVFSGCEYASLEDPDQRAFALEDPRGFLNQFRKGVILDEVQRAPDLFSFIQGIADRRDQPGQFILTGSQNFLLLEKVSQSLAGRCAVLHLLPLSQSELTGRKALPIADIGRAIPTSSVGKGTLFEALFAGSYPRIHDQGLDPQDWLRNYYQTYVERDVRDIMNVGDLEAFGRFVRLCAGRCGQLLNLTSLGADCGVTHATARRWLSILETSFVVFLLRPHYRNFSKRLVKSSKLYFLDTGLLCYLLRIRSPEDLITHAARGAVFETLVISEALKKCYNDGLDPDFYFWRDSAGHEVDLVLDRGAELAPVEIKSGETIAADFFKGLDFWRTLPRQETCPVSLVYGGEKSFRRKEVAIYSWRNWA